MDENFDEDKSSSRGDTGFNEGQKMETLKELNIF